MVKEIMKELTPLQKAGLLKELKKDIKKGIGKKCKSFSYGCWVCGVWMAFDIIKTFYSFKDKRHNG